MTYKVLITERSGNSMYPQTTQIYENYFEHLSYIKIENENQFLKEKYNAFMKKDIDSGEWYIAFENESDKLEFIMEFG